MNGRNGGKRPIASLLVLTLAFLFIPVTKAETTVYHETFAEGKGAAVQSGGATITHVTGKFFDGNGDGAALYISNRVNNWDAADFRFSDIVFRTEEFIK